MQKDINYPMMAIVNDLDALMTEIDENPQLSSWVVRLVLKSIKEKAKRMASETAPQSIYLNQLPYLDAFVNSSTLNTSQIKVLRQLR